jgi:hypothetical protein
MRIQQLEAILELPQTKVGPLPIKPHHMPQSIPSIVQHFIVILRTGSYGVAAPNASRPVMSRPRISVCTS